MRFSISERKKMRFSGRLIKYYFIRNFMLTFLIEFNYIKKSNTSIILKIVIETFYGDNVYKLNSY